MIEPHAPPLLAAAGHGVEIILALFLMLAAAKLLAELFERFKQPAVVGEILAGVLIGPSVLGWVQPTDLTSALAEIGVVFLLFAVGLETKPAAIMRVGKTAAVVAVLGVAVPFLGGWGLMRLWGSTQVESLFIGTALVATSVGITARVLSEMGLLDAQASRIILGAAVIDDILGLLVLAVVASVAAGTVDYMEVGLTALLAIGFVVFVALLGAPFLTRFAGSFVTRLHIGNASFAASVVLCLGLALAAAYIGVAAIIGAFLAGMAISEAAERDHRLHEQIRGVTELLVPFFLVNIGMQLNLAVFEDRSIVALALLLTLVAVATKLVGCGLAAWSLGLRGALQVGVGMVPRGEVGIVVAQIGLGLGIVSAPLFGVVLFMAIATTLAAPPLLRPLFARS
jgi:Kef-type K+ transport system membrane component KefB